MSLEEERKWKRILDNCVTVGLQKKDGMPIKKVRIYASYQIVKDLVAFYCIMNMFNRNESPEGFLLYLTERGIDFEILESNMEPNPG